MVSAIRTPWPVCVNRASPQAKGLVAWYPFAAAGTYLRDAAQRRHAPITGCQWQGWAGRVGGGQALYFSGTGDYAQVTDAGLPSGSSSFTLSGWFKTSTTQDAIFFVYGTNAIQQQIYLGIYEIGFGPNMGITGNAEVNLRTDFSVADGKEHLLVSTWDGTTFRLYCDGVQTESTTGTGMNLTPGGTLAIGADFNVTPGQRYTGKLADLRIYNRALSPALVKTMCRPETRWDLYAAARRGFVSEVAAATVGRIVGRSPIGAGVTGRGIVA